MAKLGDFYGDPKSHHFALRICDLIFTCQPEKYTEEFELLGGPETLEKLQYSHLDEIANHASSLIEKFFDGEVVEDGFEQQPTGQATSEQRQTQTFLI